MNLLRAVFHLTAKAYYGWALASIHPDHEDASFVVMQHALHTTQLDTFLRSGS